MIVDSLQRGDSYLPKGFLGFTSKLLRSKNRSESNNNERNCDVKLNVVTLMIWSGLFGKFGSRVGICWGYANAGRFNHDGLFNTMHAVNFPSSLNSGRTCMMRK